MKLEKNNDQIEFVQATLDKVFPDVKPSLNYSNPYTLLIATLLSAQCKDDRVNEVTPMLFDIADTPAKMSNVETDLIESIIKPCGLFRQKAKNIKALSKRLIEKFNSEIPDNFEALESLPGVGHKTASVVLSNAFGLPAFPVDTHILRLTQRWFFNSKITVKIAEKSLKSIFPQKDWFKLHLQMIFYGRQYCNRYKCTNKNPCYICSRLLIKTDAKRRGVCL